MTSSVLVLLLFAVPVAGWILALATAPLARRRHARLEALARALKEDPRYGAADRARVEESLEPLLGPGMALVLLAAVPASLLALAARGLMDKRFARRRECRPSPLEDMEWVRFRTHELTRLADGPAIVGDDPRFRRLGELAFEVELLRRPLLLLGLAVLSLPALLAYGLAYGIGDALLVLPQTAFFLAQALAPVLGAVRTRRPKGGTGPARR
jgi:hypothetical protein